MIVDLVERARAGDAEAYTDLVRRFQDAVFATAHQKVLDFEAARDIAQEAFIRAYERLGPARARSFPGLGGPHRGQLGRKLAAEARAGVSLPGR